MRVIELAMRAMTHLNIGASIAMLAWTLWTGLGLMGPDSRRTVVSPPLPTAASGLAPQKERGRR